MKLKIHTYALDFLRELRQGQREQTERTAGKSLGEYEPHGLTPGHRDSEG